MPDVAWAQGAGAPAGPGPLVNLMPIALMFVILYILPAENKTVLVIVSQVAFLMVFFIPFSYFMDSLMFRMAQKRAAKARGSSSR